MTSLLPFSGLDKISQTLSDFSRRRESQNGRFSTFLKKKRNRILIISSRCLKWKVPQILARNRQSALGLSGRTKSAREQPPRMCTIPPRQRLFSPAWLAIRRWRVARARMRNRIRIITHVLKPLHPCNTKERKRETHTTKHSTLLSSLSLQLSLSRNSTLNLANSC